MIIAASLLQFHADYSTELEELYWNYIRYRQQHRIWPDLGYQEFILFIYDYSRPGMPIYQHRPYLQLMEPVTTTMSPPNSLIGEFMSNAYDTYIIQEAGNLQQQMREWFGELPFMNASRAGHSPWIRLLDHSYSVPDYLLHMTRDLIVKANLSSDEYGSCIAYFKGTSYTLPFIHHRDRDRDDDGGM
jgi:hypothetical protein